MRECSARTVVFDLDGTLVDTKRAVFEAYRLAGVEMPEDAWGKPWRSWLNDPSAHRRKNELYPQTLRMFAQPMPLLEVALRLRVPVITGASAAAVEAINVILCSGRLNIQRVECSTDAKIFFLKSQSHVHCGLYVDDDENVRELVRMACGWRWTSSPDESTWDPISPEQALTILMR